jgi:hypothetical protein
VKHFKSSSIGKPKKTRMNSTKTVYRMARVDGHTVITRSDENGEPTGLIRRRAGRSAGIPAGGFEWGHTGGGSAQAALGVLMDYTGNVALSLRVHLYFTENTFALHDEDHCELTSAAIDAILKRASGSLRLSRGT